MDFFTPSKMQLTDEKPKEIPESLNQKLEMCPEIDLFCTNSRTEDNFIRLLAEEKPEQFLTYGSPNMFNAVDPIIVESFHPEYPSLV